MNKKVEMNAPGAHGAARRGQRAENRVYCLQQKR